MTEDKTTKDKSTMNDRLKSRKLWAFITWLIITITSIIGATTGAYNLPIESIIQWFGAVTVLYIGGQAAVDAVKELKK